MRRHPCLNCKKLDVSFPKRARSYCIQCRALFEKEQKKHCPKCDQLLPFASYSPNPSKMYGLSSYCKSCTQITHRTQGDLTHNHLRRLFFAAKESASRRKAKNRESAGEFNITVEDLHSLLVKQQGKCYYSGIMMNLTKLSDWMCSLERKDPERGYTIDNIALVCWEFNASYQWSLPKIKEIFSLIELPDSEVDRTLFDCCKTRAIRLISAGSKLVKGVRHYHCAFCDQYLTVDCFNKQLRWGCKTCVNKKNKEYRATPRGHFTVLLQSAKRNAKDRETKSRKGDSSVCNVTLEDLIQLYIKQAGRCFYSNIPLKFGVQDWGCSLERLDPTRGYEINNIAFVCKEFNTFDYTATAKHEATGSGSWSRAKFQYFVECYQNN